MPPNAAASPLLVVLVALSGCTTARIHTADVPLDAAVMVATRGESSGNRVARAELVPLQTISVEEALRQIRPEWLRMNPSSRQATESERASVYVDDTYVGELEALRLIPVSAIVDLRFLAPSAARERFGLGCHCAAGIILIATRHHD